MVGCKVLAGVMSNPLELAVDLERVVDLDLLRFFFFFFLFLGVEGGWGSLDDEELVVRFVGSRPATATVVGVMALRASWL